MVVGGGDVVVVVGGGSVGCVVWIGVVPPGGLLPPSVGVEVVVLDALVLLVLDVAEVLLVAELLLVSPLLVVPPSELDVSVEPPTCCDAGSTFCWCWDCGDTPGPAAIVATEANAVATTTPAAAIMTLADCRGAPLRLGGLNNARSGELT